MQDIIKLYIIIGIYKGSIESEYTNTIISEDNALIQAFIDTVSNEIDRTKSVIAGDAMTNEFKKDVFNYHISEGIIENIAGTEKFIDSKEYNLMIDKLFKTEILNC